MLRFLLLAILLVLLGRAFWRLFNGVLEGAAGRQPAARTPQRGVPMVRDPMCGTFVVPERAVVLTKGRDQLYFCSVDCRDRYQASRARSA